MADDAAGRADDDPRRGPVAGTASGAAYLVHPDDGPGPGVLVLHSWWGLTEGTKDLVERFADAGYTALAPDLSDGALPTDGEEAAVLLAESDPNATAALVLDSTVALRANSVDPQAPVAVVGYSMGASWGLWLATRQPESVDAVVAYYGAQNIDFDDLAAPVLGHFAERDTFVTDDDLTEMHARLLLSEKSFEVYHYPGTTHWFAEVGVADFHDPESAEQAWQRTLAFLSEHHVVDAPADD